MSAADSLLLVVGLAVAVGAFSQSVTGFGFSLLVVPACVLALPSDLVVGTVARLAVVVDLWVLASAFRRIDRRTLARLVGAGLTALPVGLVLVELVPLQAIVLAASAATLAAAGALAAQRRPGGRQARLARAGRSLGSAPPAPPDAPARREAVWHRADAGSMAAGFAAGVLGVTSGLCGPPVALHALYRRRPLAASRGTLAAFFLVVDVVAVVLHPRAVGSTPLLLLVVAGVVGIRLGVRARTRLPDEKVAVAVLGLVVLCALGAMIHSLW